MARMMAFARPAKTALAMSLAFSLGLATTALALVENGVISACYNNTTGALRVATATLPCVTSSKNPMALETPVSWNQVGPQGPAGPPGPAGANGVSGYTNRSTGIVAFGKSATVAPDGTVTTADCNTTDGFCLLRVYCPTGLKPTGGGYQIWTSADDNDPNLALAANKIVNITSNRPQSIPTQSDPLAPVGDLWRITYNSVGIDPSNLPVGIQAFARCVIPN